jgi:hypothetical protein
VKDATVQEDSLRDSKGIRKLDGGISPVALRTKMVIDSLSDAHSTSSAAPDLNPGDFSAVGECVE